MTPLTLRIAVVLVGVIGICAPVGATITAFWQPAPITPAAIADDPQLATMQSWDLIATTSGDWAGAGLVALLPGGSITFYKHSMGGFTKPSAVFVEKYPGLAFTTHVTTPNDDGTNDNTMLLGGYPPGQPISLGDPTSPIPGSFRVAWGDLFVDPPGTFQIARLTFPHDVIPLIVVGGGLALSSHTTQTSPFSAAFIPQIPEPTVLAALGLALLLTRRA